jgi:ribonuclease HII
MRASKRIEETIFAHGLKTIAGADEAGRGACAGPLVAAAVAMNHESVARIDAEIDIGSGLDSKRFTESAREEIYDILTRCVLEYQVVAIEPGEIDSHGLQAMNLAALRRAILQLREPIDYVLSDGYPIEGLEVPSLAVWKGDAISVAVGAASIIAKVTRDRMMIEFDREHPGYGFASHKGYSSTSHMEAIKALGVTSIHRLSYSNVSRLMKS